MSMLAVMVIHLPESGRIVLDEVKGYRMLLSWRQDGKALDWYLLPTQPGCVILDPHSRAPHQSGSFACGCGVCFYIPTIVAQRTRTISMVILKA